MLDALQTRPSQQPSHTEEVHMQLPLMHSLPMPHGALLPHRQRPSGLQRSARRGSQAVHWLPRIPQDETERSMQALPSQHPAQVSAKHSQAPRVQVWPLLHAGCVPHRQNPFMAQLSARWMSQRRQVSPSAPQDRKDFISQRLLAQHPPGQDRVSQVHRPPTQCCPCSHGRGQISAEEDEPTPEEDSP